MTGEADGKNPGVDSTDGVMHIWMSDLWFSMRIWLVGEKGDNRWGADTARRLNRDQIIKIARLTGCKNFVGKRKKFIFNAFVDLKPVEGVGCGLFSLTRPSPLMFIPNPTQPMIVYSRLPIPTYPVFQKPIPAQPVDGPAPHPTLFYKLVYIHHEPLSASCILYSRSFIKSHVL